MNGLAIAARAFALARWRHHRLQTRGAVDAYQKRRLARLRAHLAQRIPFYRGLDPHCPGEWPIVDKRVLLDNFADMNVAGIPLDAVRSALARGETTIDGFVIGHSTGTSGNRGYFVISEAERFVWLGTLLAKALPDGLWRRHRVALALPGFSRLYRAAEGGSRIRLGLFDLADGIDGWIDRFVRFAPDTIVAPPKVLRRLADRGAISPGTRVFSAAEVLDPVDAEPVVAATGLPLRQIYMATEGLFAVSCPYGTLHLAEDVVAFGWEGVPGTDLQTPIITDFTRRAQAMVRYRMNDLVRPASHRCPCGSAYQAVSAVEGRQDDIFDLPVPGGGTRPVTPDVLRNALLDADARIDDFRIVQTGPADVRIAIPAAADVTAVERGMRDALDRLGVTAHLTFTNDIPPIDTAKLRRVHKSISVS